jgi:hypothetical protein
VRAPSHLLVVAALAACPACGDDGQTFIDAAASIDAGLDDGGCTQVWTVEADTGTSASIAGGELTLTGTGLTGSALEVYRDGLTGDFDVSFTIENFAAGGTGAFIQAGVSAPMPQPPRLLTTAFGTFPTVGVSAADQPGGQVDLQATNVRVGTLRFVRTGTTVTLTAAALAGPTATATATGFATQPLRLGVQLGNNSGTVTPVSTARLAAFTVTSGTGVSSDTFDCDSLVP